jgi:LPS-assembly protein
MKRLLTCLALLLLSGIGAQAQFGSFGDIPIEISADLTGFSREVSTADGNVVIRYGDISIYCDHAQFNPETRDILVEGSVRIYRDGRLFSGDRALYNLETKQLSAADFKGDAGPFRFSGESLGTLGNNAYIVRNGTFTTSDSSKPDYYVKAKTVRIYPNDRVVFTNAKLYIGRTPIFWFPYVYQSLSKDEGFNVSPGYSSVMGAYVLGQYYFPLSDNVAAKVRLDLMSKRGVGVGFESRWGNARGSSEKALLSGEAPESNRSDEPESKPSPDSTAKRRDDANWGRFRAYYLEDSSTNVNRTGLRRETIDPNRYRISLQNRVYLTEDIYASVDINRLSDARFLQDFAPGEFRRDPNPDNSISLTKWDEDYSATLLLRRNLNEEQFDMTERLPELSLDTRRRPVGQGFFYESTSSGGFYRRNHEGTSLYADYDSFRADTFHQVTRPETHFGWLSVVPRFGLRGTYYSDSGFYRDRLVKYSVPSTTPGAAATEKTKTVYDLIENGSTFRPVVNAGVEASFKLSKSYEQIQSRAWGLDGLRHVVQPYGNLSLVYSGEDPDRLLQFDRLSYSTRPFSLDFPQVTAIDSIDNWSVFRLGVRNRLQTRRDDQTINWLELDTFFDVNLDQSKFISSFYGNEGTFSNLYNRLRWNPLPWANLTIDSQLPLFDDGFTEVNSAFNFMVNENLQLNIGHRYLAESTLFGESNFLTFGGYLRMGENWGFAIRELYEFQNSVLQSQSYELYRDLSSWIASFGLVVRDNGRTDLKSDSMNDYGVVLTFTLKDLPQIKVPISLDPDSIASGSGSGKNR